MDYQPFFDRLCEREDVVKLILSDCDRASDVPVKVTVRPLLLRGERCWQFESRRGAQAFHENVPEAEFLSRLQEIAPDYRQICVQRPGQTENYSFFGKRMKRSVTKNALTAAAETHNRVKRYLLPEGEAVPALVDLGIFTPQYRIVRAHYDKYKQINRFLELIDDALRGLSGQHIRILDFGCGKSYLTFILYHYLTRIRSLDAEITGYDLKADVVKHCNAVAEKYGYVKLRFLCGDVSIDTADEPDADMLVTLHACDTATDYALDYAVRNRIRYVFSVPCCQHEINLSVHRGGGDLDLLLRHGLIKERMSALLTDAIRAELLERCGYEVDVIEFVDLSHTPKNLMLRCRLTRPKLPDMAELKALRERYGFSQTLMTLLERRETGAQKLRLPE